MDWPEPIKWLIDNFSKIKAIFDKIFSIYDTFMAFLDKLKDGGYSLIQWIWANIKHMVVDVVGNTIASVFGGLFDRLKDIVLAPIHAIERIISSFYSTVSEYTSFLPTPLRIIIMISLAGAVALGIVWTLKRLYELL